MKNTQQDFAITQAPASCELLGVCQHGQRECRGSCEQVPRLPAWQPIDPSSPVQDFEVESFTRENFVTAVLIAATCGMTLGVIYGAIRWAWQGMI